MCAVWLREGLLENWRQDETVFNLPARRKRVQLSAVQLAFLLVSCLTVLPLALVSTAARCVAVAQGTRPQYGILARSLCPVSLGLLHSITESVILMVAAWPPLRSRSASFFRDAAPGRSRKTATSTQRPGQQATVLRRVQQQPLAGAAGCRDRHRHHRHRHGSKPWRHSRRWLNRVLQKDQTDWMRKTAPLID